MAVDISTSTNRSATFYPHRAPPGSRPGAQRVRVRWTTAHPPHPDV